MRLIIFAVFVLEEQRVFGSAVSFRKSLGKIAGFSKKWRSNSLPSVSASFSASSPSAGEDRDEVPIRSPLILTSLHPPGFSVGANCARMEGDAAEFEGAGAL